MAELSIILPWPDSKLSPNSRVHYRVKMGIKAKAREEGAWIAMSETRPLFKKNARLQMQLIIHPPDKRGRDMDNILASLKSSLDGVFDGINYNDKQVRRIVLDYADVVPWGKIEVCITELVPECPQN